MSLRQSHRQSCAERRYTRSQDTRTRRLDLPCVAFRSVDHSSSVSRRLQAALCQFNALTIVDNRTILDAETCMGCGVCVTQCAQGALTLVRDPQKGAPLEIRELMDAVH